MKKYQFHAVFMQQYAETEFLNTSAYCTSLW